MAASATDLLQEVGINTATTLDAPGYTIGATSITVASTAGMPTATGITFAIDEVDSDGVQEPNSYNEYVGTVDTGTSITNVAHQNGVNRNYAAGATTRVYIPVSAERENRIVAWGLEEHKQLGGHSDITTDSITNAGTLTQTGASNLVGALTIRSYDGWISTSDTWVYASSTTFTIAGVDRTAQFPVGTKIKLTQTSAKYFYVTAAAFSTDTTITVTGGTSYTLANAAITAPSYSYMETPQGFPTTFSWTPSWTTLTVGDGTLSFARFKIVGGYLEGEIRFTLGGTSSFGTGDTTFSFPITVANDYVQYRSPLGTVIMNDANGSAYIGWVGWNSSTTAILQKHTISGSHIFGDNVDADEPFTWASTDSLHINFKVKLP